MQGYVKLTLSLLGRKAIDARDDNGLAAWKGAHLLLAHALESAAARAIAHPVPFTRCVQLPVAALFGAGDLYAVPIETYVPPANAPRTIVRDQRVFKHMGTLTRNGSW